MPGVTPFFCTLPPGFPVPGLFFLQGRGPEGHVLRVDGVGEVHEGEGEVHALALAGGADAAPEVRDEPGEVARLYLRHLPPGLLLEAEHGAHGGAAGVFLAVHGDGEVLFHGASGLGSGGRGGLAGVDVGLAVVFEGDDVDHVVLRRGGLLDGGDDELQAS